MSMKAFIPLTKIDAQRREVWGTFVEEAPDQYGEIMDYAMSKPRIEEWSNQIHKISGGESYGNVREMHGKVAAGKLIAIEYDDDNKRINVGAKIVDDAAWEKVLERVYNGFSIGGDYGKKWKDPLTKGTRYEAIPVEATLADNPAMYGATFQMIKTDGATELQKFAKPTQPIHKFELLQRLTKTADKPKVEKVAVLAALKKCYDACGYVEVMPEITEAQQDAFDVSDAAYALGNLAIIAANEMDEAADDPAEKADAQLVVDAAKGLLEFIAGELDELTEDKPEDTTLAMAAAIGALAKAGARHSATDQTMIQTMHDQTLALGATCATADDGAAEKTTDAGELQKNAAPETDTLEKTFTDKLTALETAHAAELEKVTGANDAMRKELDEFKAQLAKFASSPDPRLPVLKVAEARGAINNPAEQTAQQFDALEKAMHNPMIADADRAAVGRVLAFREVQKTLQAGPQKIGG